MSAKLKHPVKFSNEGKKMTILDKDAAINALSEDACERINRCINALLGADAGQLGDLIAKAAMTEAINAGMTAVDIAELDDDHLPDGIRHWLSLAGIKIGNDKPKEGKTRRKKIGNADICALPTTLRVSSPTYGVIASMDIQPRVKWMLDEITARFPAAQREYLYDEIRPDFTPTGEEDSIIITADDVGTYAKIAYNENTPIKREAIAIYIEHTTDNVVCEYRDSDGSIRRYHGSLLGISEAPQPGTPDTPDTATKIGNLRFPIRIHVSDILKLCIKSKYGRIELAPQRNRIHENAFAEYEAIKCWAASVEPFRTQEMRKKGKYSHVMIYTTIAGYADAEKSTQSRMRARTKKAAAKYAADSTTTEMRVTWKPDGTNGIKFVWLKL